MPHLILVAFMSLVLTQPGADSRPRDPWVIRGVLDQQARMVTVALDEDLWVAYDTKACVFYKAWTGDVDYTGAVYDTLHGPQPTIRGTIWLEQTDTKNDWSLIWPELSGEVSMMRLTAKWKGYRFKDGGVQFVYDMVNHRGNVMRVTESPEVSRIGGPDGELALTRTFQVENLAAGSSLTITIPTKSPLGPLAFQSNGRLISMKNHRILQINNGDPVEVTTFIKPPQVEMPPTEKQEEDEVPFFLTP
jgi:hypothetical protein